MAEQVKDNFIGQNKKVTYINWVNNHSNTQSPHYCIATDVLYILNLTQSRYQQTAFQQLGSIAIQPPQKINLRKSLLYVD